MNASNVRQGNIILDLALLNAEQLTADHIEDLYELSQVDRDVQIERLLTSARTEDLNLLQMSSSYGAQCVVLFSSVELYPNHIFPEASEPFKE